MHAIKEKVLEDERVVQQIRNNSPEQIMIGDYPGAVRDAVIESLNTHSGMAGRVLRNEAGWTEFARLILALILQEQANGARVN